MTTAEPFPWEDTRKRIYGYKSIGDRVGMSKSAVHRYADANMWLFPLPLRDSPAGAFVYEDELTFWFYRWNLPRGVDGAIVRRTQANGTHRTPTKATRKRREKDRADEE